MDLEKEVGLYGAANGPPMMFPRVSPAQLYGLEINQYAQELAQVVVWSGYLQWMTANGFQPRRDPVLESFDNTRLQDALLDRSDPDNPKEAEWPRADFIIGNPPFLGGKRLRTEFGDEYVDDLFAVFTRRVAREADLVCYFFEKARVQIEHGELLRAGLLATNSIRGGANREVLKRIRTSVDIFLAWDDEPWILEGAAVRISIVGFDDGDDPQRMLNGVSVPIINSSLSAAIDVTMAKRIPENLGIGFMGDKKIGSFDINGELAREWIAYPVNPNGRGNRDVVVPWINGMDITRRKRDMWIVDFGVATAKEQAALYEAPFEYVETHVMPEREGHRNPVLERNWWIHGAPATNMRAALHDLERFVVTPRVAKYRLFD